MSIGTNAEQKVFKSFSKNLTKKLKHEGIFPIKNGVHTTGVNISIDDGKTWDSFPSVVSALEKYYDTFTRDELEFYRSESFQHRLVVTTDKEINGVQVLVRYRIRHYQEFLVTDRLSYMLKQWSEESPNKK